MTRKFKIVHFALFTAICVFAKANVANAYSYGTCTQNCLGIQSTWNMGWHAFPTLAVHSAFGSTPSSCDPNNGSTSLNDVRCAAAAWYDVFSSSFYFTISANSSFSTFTTNDNVNQVAWSNLGANGPLAVTNIRSQCTPCATPQFLETDIVVNTSKSNTYYIVGAPFPTQYANSTNPAYTSLRQVLLHEMGHALGLNHQDGFPTAMNSIYPNGGWSNGTATGFGLMLPHSDDRAGDAALYSNGQADLVDVAVTPMCWVNGQAGYDFPPTPPSTTNRPNPENTTTSKGNCASPGDSVLAMLTLENLSNAAFTNMRLGFYLSTDSQITTSDTLIATWTWSPASYGHTNPTFSIGIPTGASANTYYFGVILDDTNIVASEEYDSNNAVALLSQLVVKATCP